MTVRGRWAELEGDRLEFGVGGSAYRYQLRRRALFAGSDYWIENADGDRVVRIDGGAMMHQAALTLEDPGGRPLCRTRGPGEATSDVVVIEGPDRVRRATLVPGPVAASQNWVVRMDGGEDVDVLGDVSDHEYAFELRGRTVAEVSKRWFQVRDTFGVQVAPDQDVVLLLAAVVALDA